MTADDPLPGLELPARPPSDLEAAVRRTVKALHEQEAVTEVHALDLALMLKLTGILDDMAAARKTSMAHATARLIWEIRNGLTAEAEGDVDERLREAMEQLGAMLEDGAP